MAKEANSSVSNTQPPPFPSTPPQVIVSFFCYNKVINDHIQSSG